MLPLGGLPRLIENLQAAFVFDAPQSGRLDALAVYRLTGQWKPAALAELIPEYKDPLLAGESPDWKSSPANSPSKSCSRSGKTTCFPIGSISSGNSRSKGVPRRSGGGC